MNTIKYFLAIAAIALIGYNTTLEVKTAQAGISFQTWMEWAGATTDEDGKITGMNNDPFDDDDGPNYTGGMLGEICVNGSGYGSGMETAADHSHTGPYAYCEPTGNCNDNCSQWSVIWRNAVWGSL